MAVAVIHTPPIPICMDCEACLVAFSLFYRGRRFDENTLPPRSHIILRSRKSIPKQPYTAPQSTPENLQQLTLVSKPTSSLSPGPKSAPKQKSPRQISPAPRPLDGDNDEGGVPAVVVDQGGRLDDQRTPTAATNADIEEARILLGPHTADRRSKSPLALSSHSFPAPQSDGTLSRPPSSLASTSTASESMETRPAIAMNRRSSRSPLNLAPVPTSADPQSSPASTNAPDSAHTPEATAGSPGTSPGVDLMPIRIRACSS